MFGLPVEVILSIASLILGWIGEQKKQQQADLHQLLMAGKDSANAAQKRGGTAIRMIVALIIITISFGGLLVPQFIDGGGVSQIYDKEAWLNLFGLIKLGGGKEVITATGFVIPDYMRYSVINIVHFLFGMAAGKR